MPSNAAVVRLTADECFTMLHAIKIAVEDGSIYADRMPGDGEYEQVDCHLDGIIAKLKRARRRLGAPVTKLEGAI